VARKTDGGTQTVSGGLRDEVNHGRAIPGLLFLGWFPGAKGTCIRQTGGCAAVSSTRRESSRADGRGGRRTGSPTARAGTVLLCVGVLALLSVSLAQARAAGALVLAPDGHVFTRIEPQLVRDQLKGAETGQPAGHPARRSSGASAGNAGVRSELRQLYQDGAISSQAYRHYRQDFAAALGTESRLGGTRAVELEAVIQNLDAITSAGQLTPARLPALFLTLDRNRQWWSDGPVPAARQIVGFSGSELDWEYYPGQGIELQPLASFGKADWFFTHGRRYYARGQQLLAELIPLATRRAGGLTWEYYFNFDGGAPPWVSAMAQATALQALADGYKATADGHYVTVAQHALAVFRAAPPVGVAVATPRGVRFVQYSFAATRNEEIINAFLQTLIGLGDYAGVSGNGLAARLFAQGNAEAEYELPSYDTGAWSLYQPGVEDDLSYHELVTGFLEQLCAMTSNRIYCRTAARFQRYLKTPPALKLLTRRVRIGVPATIQFRVSKVSRVGITIIHGGRTLFLTSGDFTYGVHAFAIPALARAGSYTVKLDATDLAGNYIVDSFSLEARS
jgi:D-glucuronyl C5-epimerase C-terminus